MKIKLFLLSMILCLTSCCHFQHMGQVQLNKDVVKSVVIIKVKTATAGWLGTAFSIGNGNILTNKHICSAQNEAEYTLIDVNGNRYSASFVRFDALVDVCLVHTDASIPALKLAKKDAKSGDAATIIGSPHGVFPFYNTGFISGYEATTISDVIDGREFVISFKAQYTSVQTSPGNSGSPVLNDNGEVIGILFAGRSDANYMSLIVPIELIQQFLHNEQNIKSGW